MLTTLLKDVVKDTVKQPVEEIHVVRSGRVPSAETSVLVELGCITLSSHGCVHQLAAFLALYSLYLVGMIDN